jgi:ADP-heptose:LPS heptosyltransferase
LPNRLDWLCKRTAKAGGKKVLLAWNRGLGDIALGLYAIVYRIRALVPEAQISFLVRENLIDGFSLLDGVEVFAARGWRRGEPYDVGQSLREIGRSPLEFDLILPWPSPTDWVRWQHGTLVPRLSWNPALDALWKKFGLEEGYTYIGAQASAETNYGLWRNWPESRWREFFKKLRCHPNARVILFGFGKEPRYESDQIVDLRGKTTLFELLSIIKNRCTYLIAPDSGVLSMAYYLDQPFPLQVVSLWADPRHGILKQNVASPNPLLIHRPLIGAHRDSGTIEADTVLETLFGAGRA